jgi:two-component system phosphate regulon sensor histidine kinase PhoR
MGARATLGVAGLAVFVVGLGVVLTARAMRANAQLAEMRSTFVSTVTHELKTPIATIRAAGDMLASGRVSDRHAQGDYARLVVDEAKRLTRLLNNLLAYSRITDVTEAYSFQPLDLGQLVSQSLRDYRSRLDSADCRVEVNIPPDLPSIQGDITALTLMFDNVIDNAIRYSKANPRIDINARVAHDSVTLEVVDQGIGIPESEIDHVTRKFFRGRNSSSEGSGLGLAITAQIVRDHHGSLHIKSAPGVGTTVSLTFPVAESLDDTPGHVR